MKTLPSKLSVVFSTSFGIGYMPKAPGTFGSIPGLFLGAWLYQTFATRYPDQFTAFSYITLSLIAISIFSYFSIHLTEKYWDSHDNQKIVIDEVVGQAIALAFIPPTMINIIIAFILFRFFDITKLSIIGWADKKVPGALGTLLDDIFAGLISLAIVLTVYAVL